MSLPTPDKIHDATLSGIPLLLVMLACFLVGALCMRFAIELDARALWDAIRRKATAPDATDETDAAPTTEDAK